MIKNGLKKSGVKPKSILTMTSSAMGQMYDSYLVFFTYKNYIICTEYIECALRSFKISYDPDKCEIPKDVAFDLFNQIKIVNVFKSTEKSIKAADYYKNSSLLSKLQNKYGDKYDVNEKLGRIIISIKE